MGEGFSAVVETLWAEIHDLVDLHDVTQLAVRLTLAAVLGGAIGYERGKRGKAAGMRTHMLVAIGSALFLAVCQQIHMSHDQLSRVIQGLVAGIGFLGAGAILKMQDQQEIVGLTTAASLWMTAAIGSTCGLGRGGSALLATFLVWMILEFLPRVMPEPRNGGPTGDAQSR